MKLPALNARQVFKILKKLVLLLNVKKVAMLFSKIILQTKELLFQNIQGKQSKCPYFVELLMTLA